MCVPLLRVATTSLLEWLVYWVNYLMSSKFAQLIVKILGNNLLFPLNRCCFDLKTVSDLYISKPSPPHFLVQTSQTIPFTRDLISPYIQRSRQQQTPDQFKFLTTAKSSSMFFVHSSSTRWGGTELVSYFSQVPFSNNAQRTSDSSVVPTFNQVAKYIRESSNILRSLSQHCSM